jgi:hypothetical protein
MVSWIILVRLPEDRSLMFDHLAPRPQINARYLFYKGQLSPRQQASAPRPRGLEHAAGEWTLGGNIPERPLRVLRSRARLLDGAKRARFGRLHRRQCSADRRGKSGRVGPQRSCPQRSCPIAADARAYARPFRRAPRQVRSRRRRDRRSYPLTLAGPLSRALVQTRLRSAASRPDAPCIFGTILRQRNTVLHGPFSITVGGSYRPVGRRISLRDRRGHRAISLVAQFLSKNCGT